MQVVANEEVLLARLANDRRGPDGVLAAIDTAALEPRVVVRLRVVAVVIAKGTFGTTRTRPRTGSAGVALQPGELTTRSSSPSPSKSPEAIDSPVFMFPAPVGGPTVASRVPLAPEKTCT